mgnify:CR=1 FL=1
MLTCQQCDTEVGRNEVGDHNCLKQMILKVNSLEAKLDQKECHTKARLKAIEKIVGTLNRDLAKKNQMIKALEVKVAAR